MQPCYSDKKYIKNIDDDFSTSKKVYDKGISLPSSFLMSESDQLLVITKIWDFYENRN